MSRPLVLGAALLLAVSGAAPHTLLAQGDSAVTVGIRAEVHSAVLREDRPVMVHLPPSYLASRTSVYPVVYVLDGDAHFLAVSAMVDFLARNRRAPEMIVVAIPNTKDRTHDLTPPGDIGVVKMALNDRGDSVSNTFPSAGGAAKFRAFLTDELAPWVESRYRTAPYRVLVGHSFGGLFALDALVSSPRSFNAYVAISPSLWWDHGKFEQRVAAALTNPALAGVTLYMTTGEREPREAMIAPAQTLAAAFAHRADGFQATYRVMPTETHNSNPFRTTYDALERIFDGWEPPDSVTEAAVSRGEIAPLEGHYAALTKRFGYPIPLSPDVVNSMAYTNLASKRVDVAMRLFRYSVEKSPDYANGWDSLADGLQAQGKLAEAVKAQEKAVQVGEATKDPALPTYRERLDRLRKLAARR